MSNITIPLIEILDEALSVPVYLQGNVQSAPSVVVEFDETTGIRTLDEYLWEQNDVVLRVHTLHETNQVNQEDAEAIKQGIRGVLEPRIEINQISQYVPPPDISNVQYDHEDQTAYDILLEYEFKNSTLLANTGGGSNDSILAAELLNDLTVKNVNVGNISNGDFFEEGTKLEALWRALLIKSQNATLSLNNDGANTVEIGSTVNQTLISNFNQRDAGPLIDHIIDGTSFGTNNRATKAISFTMGNPSDITAQESFQSSAQYDESDVFSANTINASTKINGRRYTYWGTSNPEPTTPSVITSLQNKSFGRNNFTINVQDGDTSVEFAYPAALGDVSLIKFKGAVERDDTSNYTKTVVSGVGLTGFEIDYNVYRQAPGDPYSNVSVEVTI